MGLYKFKFIILAMTVSAFTLTAEAGRVREPASTTTMTSNVSAPTQAQVSIANYSLSKSALVAGETQNINVNILSNIRVSNLYIGIRIYNSSNQMVGKRYFKNISLDAGIAKPFSYSYFTSTSLPAGTYSVQVGVWDQSNWYTYRYDEISTFSVVKTAPTPAPTTGSFDNSGFENGLTGYQSWGGNPQAVSGDAHSGNYALQVSSAAGGVGRDILSLLSAGKSYELSAYAKTNNASEYAELSITLRNSSGVNLVSKSVQVTSSSYTLYKFSFTVPDGTTFAQLGVWKNAGTSTMSVDDFALVATSSTTEPAPAPAPAPAPGSAIITNPANMLMTGNPGFELGLQVSYSHYGYNNWGNATAVTGQAHSGSYAMQLAPNGGLALNNLSHYLEPGKTYRFSVYGKAMTTNQDVNVFVNLKNASGSTVLSKSVTINSTSYQAYSIDFTVSSDVTSSEIYFYNNSSANAYFDDLFLGYATPEATRYTYASATPSGGISYPFGSRKVPYVAGILPNNMTKASQDAVIHNLYAKWKTLLRTTCGHNSIWFGSAKWHTVSEGIGYGMLITALMAGHDSEAQTIFNNLFKFARSKPAYKVSPYLMNWAIKSDCSDGGEGYAAIDGDLDIAMGLLMADKQWGSAGAINYMDEAIKTINAIKYSNFHPTGVVNSGKGLARTSDMMISHFKAFKKATGDSRWDAAVNKSFELLDLIQTRFAPNTGLMPGFIMN